MSTDGPKARLLLLDSSVLLLWLVWQTDARILSEYKRVAAFVEADGELLATYVRGFNGFLSTPHVLAEAGNHLDQAPMHRRFSLLAAYKDYVRSAREIFTEAKVLIDEPHFDALGLTDAGLIELCRRATVLTMDWELSNRIRALGGRGVNFNHLRADHLLRR